MKGSVIMNGFVKVSNNIFDYSLSPKAMFVYIYLCSKVSCLQTVSVSCDVISKACNMDAKTVRSAVAELEKINLVCKQNRYNSRGYIANRYYVTNIISNSKSWFKVDREIFKTGIKATDFIVYCFVICKMSENDMQAFPSLTAIQKGSKISRGRISQAIQYLRSYTFLNRIKRHYKRTGAYRHNRYIHLLCNIKNTVKKCKRKAYASQAHAKKNIRIPNSITIIHQFKTKCNTFLQV